MWARRAIAGVLLLTLAVLPVFAGDSETEVVSNVESTSDNSDTGDNNDEADSLVVLNQIAENQEIMNQNIVYGVGAILLGAGTLLGFMSAKELCKIWLE